MRRRCRGEVTGCCGSAARGRLRCRELCFAELAIARHAGAIATENEVAAILDLKYRMPRLWQAVLDLRIEGWVARKVAKDARRLSKDRVQLVDIAVAGAADESPGRLLAIAEAKIIEADPDLHRAKVEEDAKSTRVWLSKVRPGETIDPLSGEPATLRIGAQAVGRLRDPQHGEDRGPRDRDLRARRTRRGR